MAADHVSENAPYLVASVVGGSIDRGRLLSSTVVAFAALEEISCKIRVSMHNFICSN